MQLRGDTDTLLPAVTNGRVPLSALGEVLLPPEERRVVTVMFADIIGSTPMAARMDPEDMRAILTGYFNLMTQQLRKHGGTVEKYIGDAVMAVFGTPITHEDDPDRAIRAALDMQAALTTFNEQRQVLDTDAIRLQMRIGINTGEVAVPANEQHQRQDFLITGDAVNVAARLQQVAAPDTILVGERTYLATRGVFDVRAIAPLQLKGKAEPLVAYVIQGLHNQTFTITQHPRGLEGLHVPIVGRSLELTLMHTTYARVVAERNPHLITILGVPGIGKSRLVREFVAREQESVKSATSNDAPPRVLLGRCPPYGESITYWPLIEILRSLLQVQEDESNETLQLRFTAFVNETLTNAKRSEASDEIVTTILRSIGQGLSTASFDGPGTRERPKREYQRSTHTLGTKQATAQAPLLRAWRVLLEALAQVQPLIIVVDDLQWADEALLDLLAYLTERITTVPVLLLCPARPDFFDRRRDWGGGHRNFTTIELDALSTEESSDLVDALLNTDDLPEVLRHTILTRAEGNPFFVEEIIRMFIDQGLLVREREEDGGICWRLGHANETLVSELTTLAEPPDDTLLNMHYVLPLPRVPDTVQGVLAARVDLLHPLEKRILQHAAIIGRTFWLSSLVELTHDLLAETILKALESLMCRDFVVEDEDIQVRSPIENDRIFSFKHILIRDVVYNNIPRARRSQEHAQLAFWLEDHTASNQTNYIELLAYHYQQALITWSAAVRVVEAVSTQAIAPDSEPAIIRLTRPELRRRAIKYLTLAGDQALNSYYTLRALQAYNDALELLLDPNADIPTLVAMYEKLGDAFSQRSTQEEAWQAYRKALRFATGEGINPETVDVLYLYERLAELSTRWLGGFDTPPNAQEVRGYIDAGLKLLEGKALTTERVAFLTYQAFWYIRQLETTTFAQKVALAGQALASGHEALHLAEQLNNPSALSLALDAVGFIYTEYHKYNEAQQIQRRRQQLEEKLTDREELYDLYISLGKIHTQVADYPTALMWFGRAWSNAQTMESPSLLLTSMAWRMWTWLQWNRWQEAHQVALDILRLIDQYQQDEKRQLWALETLAMIEYQQGSAEQGDYYARKYKRLVDKQGERAEDETTTPNTSMCMRDIYLACEDWTRAATGYKEKLNSSEPLPSPEVLTTLAELMVIIGEDAEAQENMCTRALTVAEESGACKSLALAFRARGRMYIEQQRWSLAKDDLCQALQRCEALDIPWERGITLYYIGMLYKRRASTFDKDTPNRRTTDLERARYHFEQALGFFESISAVPSVERVKLAMIQENKTLV
ncbi:MAG: hypothetical protein NVS4B1_36260 [Ktedonobacteraceae bacterium]